MNSAHSTIEYTSPAKLLHWLLVGLHILAALKHGLFDKDGVLQRMLSVSGTADGET